MVACNALYRRSTLGVKRKGRPGYRSRPSFTPYWGLSTRSLVVVAIMIALVLMVFPAIFSAVKVVAATTTAATIATTTIKRFGSIDPGDA